MLPGRFKRLIEKGNQEMKFLKNNLLQNPKNIIFEDTTHSYLVDNNLVVSCTTLLKDMGIAPDYSGLSEDALKKYAERGSFIHQEIENFAKYNEEGWTPEFQNFKKWIDLSHLKIIASELIVGNYQVAGTIDLVLQDLDGNYIIADIKTTSTIHTDSVSWQCSIYKKLLDESKRLNRKVNKLLCLQFNQKGTLKTKELKCISEDAINNLCKRYWGENYFNLDNYLTPGNYETLIKCQEEIVKYSAFIKLAEQRIEEIKAALTRAMRENGVKKYENDDMVLTYVGEAYTTSLDSKKLKEEMPEIFMKYQKQTLKGDYVKIKFKKGGQE